MKSDTPLDYAVFQLSPRRSRCDLIVSCAGSREKIASGLVKPFVAHLKVAEQQLASAVQSVRLEVEHGNNAETWFTKGTLERFVRFVSTPEILELVNTFDEEMSQLESARRIYSQGTGGQNGTSSGDGATTVADTTKKELLRAIDVRLVAVKQDLTTAFARATSAGFTSETVSELQLFADQFGAARLFEACSKFILLCGRRLDEINPRKATVIDRAVRSSCGSDMSIDEDPSEELHSEFKRDEGKESDRSEEKEKKDESGNQNESPQTAKLTRRLSVQERINLFENKQKETSGGGSKPVVGKSPELRRLSSDVSSGPPVIERAVLKRWSGASDMSIDLSSDKKDNESPLYTPSLASQDKSEEEPFTDIPASVKSEVRDALGRASDSGSKIQIDSWSPLGGSSSQQDVTTMVLDPGSSLKVSAGFSVDASESCGPKSTPGHKDQANCKTENQSRSTIRKAEDHRLTNKVMSQNQFRSFPDDTVDPTVMMGQARFKGSFGGDEGCEARQQVASETQTPGDRNQAALQGQVVVEGVASKGRLMTQLSAPTGPTVYSGQLEAVTAMKIREAATVPRSRAKDDSSGSQTHFSSSAEDQGVGKKDLGSEEQPGSLTSRRDDSGSQRLKFQKQVSAPEPTPKSHVRKDEISSDNEVRRSVLPNKMIAKSQVDLDKVSTMPEEQVPKVWQSKGNQELNDELKIKANELEKLFAEHKLRGHSDQSSSSRGNRPSDSHMEQSANSINRTPQAKFLPAQFPDKNSGGEPLRGFSNLPKQSAPMKSLDGKTNGDYIKQNFSELVVSDGSRGTSYDKYMQRRDAKLRKEWSSNREDKEAKLKTMHDSYERSRAEMKAKFSGVGDKQDSAVIARHHAERPLSFNTRAAMKRQQHPIDLLQSEDEDLTDFTEQMPTDHVRSFSEVSLGDSATSSTQTKMLLSSKVSSTSAFSTSAVKTSNSSSGRRKMQPENPMAHSVPNFSEFRKDNTKLSSGTGIRKTISRAQARSGTRSKSISEEIHIIKEEKPRRSQLGKKSCTSHSEFKNMSSLDSEGDKGQSDIDIFHKLPRNIQSKTSLKKGSGIPSANGATEIVKAVTVSETMNNTEESDYMAFEAEDIVDTIKYEVESEVIITEDYGNMNGQKRLSQVVDKLVYSASESGDALRSFSQGNFPVLAGFPAALPPTFYHVGSAQDSPSDSPVSWNSRVQHAFSYAHETSDVDASADSPMGSPTSWNSHPLNQAESDATRMRKKWGSAQKPVLVSNSSASHSRKDVTKGFKRLLQFGRKSRGTDSLADWISATTSEGDDDTEDGRDPASRSSEDLRKSRMGLSRGHPSDDSFSEAEFYSEQAQALHSSIPAPPGNYKLKENFSGSPVKASRSFFSLSTFRSKGSESKPR